MNKQNMMENQRKVQKKAFTWADYFLIILNWRKFILVNFIAISILTFVVVSLMPKIYFSKTVVIPSTQEMSGAYPGLLNISRMLGFVGGAGAQPEIFKYISILKSRTLQEEVIKEFDLINVYKVPKKSMELALKRLNQNVVIKINDEGALVIGVLDEDPQRAADIANFFVKKLHEYNTRINITEAKAKREFLEKRLLQNELDLSRLEEKIKELQESSGLIMGTGQTLGSVEMIAELYARKTLKEMEIELYKKTLDENNPKYHQALIELEIINKRLENVPQETIDALRVYREYLIQQKIRELLMPIYEQARLEEIRDTPTVIVLDPAVPSELKAKPKRLRITIAMGFVGLILSILYAIFTERFRMIKSEDDEKARKIIEIERIIKNTIPFVRSRK
ncbi:MAG: hypothetical protein GXO78_15515 [Calditrichaeota bacterium]|nr:hypothetical protein [Calditrichota bacterium]